MDNQITKTDISIQRIALSIAAVLLGLLLSVLAVYQLQRSDPYVQSVLSLPGDAEQGEVIFQMNCSSCHGLHADGRVGPSLHHVSARKSRIGLIHQVISGDTPPMPQFQPTAQEMADLLEYLEKL